MSDYKTTDYIIGIVYSLLGSITKPKYLKTKPTNAIAAEYVVINSLPINANVMQKCYVNVNYHVKDITAGTLDITKLETYDCKNFDSASGLCKDYKNRPDICKNSGCINPNSSESIDEQFEKMKDKEFIKIKQ